MPSHSFRNLRASLLGATSGIVFAISATPSYAQAGPPSLTTPPVPEQTTSASGLETVVVTAQRRSEDQSKVPVSVSALNADQLQERSITTETELQAAVPGLVVKTGVTGDGLNYTLRGQTLDTNSGSSPGVLTYVNDVQLTSETALSFYDLQSVQVLKGPQGTLFGRNDTGGAVLYTTAQPTDDFGGYVTARFGNYDFREGLGAINIPVVPGILDVRVAADFKAQDGYVTNLTDGRHLGDIDNRSGRLSVLLTPFDGFKNTLIVEYGTTDGTELNGELYSVYPVGSTNNGYALNTTVAEIYSPGSPFWSPALAAKNPGGILGYLNQQRSQGLYIEDLGFTPLHKSHALSVVNTTSYDLNPDLVFKNILGLSNSVTRADANTSGSPFGILNLYIPGSGGTVGPQYHIDQWSEEAQLLGNAFDHQLQYIVGLYVAGTRNRTDFPVGVGADLPRPLASFHFDSVDSDRTQALFAQGTYDLSRWTGISGLSFTGGIRETVEQTSLLQLPDSLYAGTPKQRANENHPSWQLGAQYQVTPELLLYAVSRGSWRAGNFNNNAPTEVPVTDANRFFAEKTHDFEVGEKFNGEMFDHAVRLNVALYDQTVTDLQRNIFLVIGGNFVSFTHNIPEADIKGVELETEIQAASWLRLGAAGAYTDAEYTKPVTEAYGTTLTFSSFPDTPRYSGSVYAQVWLPVPEQWGDMSIRADLYGVGSQYFSGLAASISPGTEIPGYGLVNMRYNWEEIFGSKVSFSVFVRNLLNKGFYQGGLANAGSYGANSVIPGEPQMFGVELNYKL